jgi:2-polyprenyl-3-methyl-5-hydroxy-6-metoxy-1,4-benzoquinol methylase
VTSTEVQPICPLCGGVASIKWLELSFAECSRCGALFRHPMPSEDELDGLYSGSWRAPDVNTAETGSTSEEIATAYVRHLRRALGANALAGVRIIDFGAGRGTLARILQAQGASVVCVDPYGANDLRHQGLAAEEALNRLTGDFTGACLVEVIEHLPDPVSVLRAIRRLLEPGGWIYLSTPNRNGLNARLTKANWREANKPGHLCLFTAHGVEKILASAGFERIARQRWLVDFGSGFPRRLARYAMQMTRTDGGLRYVAYATDK